MASRSGFLSPQDTPDLSTVSSITVGEETKRDFSSPDDIYVSTDDGDQCLFHLRLVGREKEQEMLRNVWNRVSSSSPANDEEQPQSEIVNVIGESGVGKSFLIERTLRENAFDDGGIFVTAKFDQLSFATPCNKNPFHTVVSLLSDLCDFLFGSDVHQSLAKSIQDDIPAYDWELFAETVVPSSSWILLNNKDESHNYAAGTRTRNSSDDSFTLLKQACRSFLVAVAKQKSLVLFFDDLQWVDPESLELIDYLVNHTLSSRIMYVFAYRIEDGRTDPFVLGKDDNNKGGDENKKTRTCEIRLSRLTLEQVTDIFRDHQETKGSDDVDVATVGTIVFEKTQGNPFFITQFLEHLRVNGFLTVSSAESNKSLRWEWSSIQEMARLDAGSGVLECIDKRVYQIDATSRSVLVFAAHMGFEFRRDLLETVMMGPTKNRDATTRLVSRALKNAESRAFIIAGKDGNAFCFMHDRVQQCLYEMMAEGTMKEMTHLNIGRRLQASPFIEDDSVLILAVHSMNLGKKHITEESEKLSLAELNRRASVHAVGKASFSAARYFLRTAIELLDERTMWEEHYELTLDLHVSLARVACNCGDSDEVHRTARKVSANARSVLDKLPVLEARVTALSLEGETGALLVAHEALEELGEPLDRKPKFVKLLFRLLRTRSKTRRKTNEELRSLPVMTDRKQMAVQRILYKMILPSFVKGNDLMVLAVMDKMLRISLKYGRFLSTPASFAGFGMIESVLFGNYKEAGRLGDLAIEMIQEPDMKEASAVTICLACVFIFPWRDSLRSNIDQMYDGFVEGMMYGDTYYGVSNLTSYIAASFDNAMPLVALERKIRSYCERMSEFSESSLHLLLSRSFHQAALNLMGQCANPLELNGEALQENEIFLNDEALDVSAAVDICKLLKLELACHYRKLDKAVEFLKAHGTSATKDIAGNFLRLQLFACLTYLDLAITKTGRKRRVFVGKSRKSIKQLQGLASKGCSTAGLFCLLLEAERHSVSTGQPDMAMYDMAIEALSDEGFLQYAAVAAERAGLALRRSSADRYDGEDLRKYLKRGLDLNVEWEAEGKVERYREEYQEYLSVPMVEIPDSVHIQGDE